MPNRVSGITVDCLDPDRLVRFWTALLDAAEDPDPLPGWRQIAAGADRPRINFQPVGEPKTGKTRVHLDVSVEDIDVAIARVGELGGAWTGIRHDYDEGVVVVMTDPEDTEFCLVQYYDTAGSTD